MKVIDLDISNSGISQVICAKQGDVGRKFEVRIFDHGQAYPVPEGAALSVWYYGPSGDGNYSAIGDKSAFSVSGNTVTVELITQMLTNPGTGNLCLVIHHPDGQQIGLWNIRYHCEAVPGYGSQAAQQYYTALSELASQTADNANRAQAAADTFATDTSLSVAGKAADAAAAGAALGTKLTAVESTVYPGCYYRTVGGATEWLNPPMVAGVEYRTAERWLGKTVYTRLVDCGGFADDKQVPVSMGQRANVIRASVVVGQYVLPALDAASISSGGYISYWVSGTTDGFYVWLYGGSAVTGFQTYAQVWYTKD